MLALRFNKARLLDQHYDQPRLSPAANGRRSVFLHHVYTYAFSDVSDGANPLLQLAGALLRV